MHKITLHGAPRMPWKNGGGVTVELAVAPSGAGLGDFDWRISCAQVAAGGPFSAFPGVDRSLAVLQGAGLRLDFAAGETHTLTTSSAPLAFPGEQPVAAELLGGPVGDFNLMTRRGRWSHRLQRLSLTGEQTFAWSAELALVYCAAGTGLDGRLADGRQVWLAAGEGLLLDHADGGLIRLLAQAASEVLLAQLWRR